MKFKNIIIVFLIICFLIAICFCVNLKSLSHFTSQSKIEDNNFNVGSFPKARVRIYQVIMPLVHEYDEDDYTEIFKKMAINEIIPVINNPTTIDKINRSFRLEFNLRKDIKFNPNDEDKAMVLHHIVAISNGTPFNDGREKINFTKKILECELDNIYKGETSKKFYNVGFRRRINRRNPINLQGKEKYILTFNWDKEKKQYILNRKNEKAYYNADLILFDITSFIIDDANAINELIEEMELYGDEILRLYSTNIDISVKLTTDKFKVTKSQRLHLLKE